MLKRSWLNATEITIRTAPQPSSLGEPNLKVPKLGDLGASRVKRAFTSVPFSYSYVTELAVEAVLLDKLLCQI